MSLITSSAFQLSPAIQTRSFLALGTLANAEVDDDFLYQILVAFNAALSKADETYTLPIVSMLRCICKVAPALPKESRFPSLLFWLAVALIQSSHLPFYVEATQLLRVSLENMEKRGAFKDQTVSGVLLKSREQLKSITSQLDELLRLSFESSFSFSLAAIIFKGIRHSGLKESAEVVLRSLLCVTVRTEKILNVSDGVGDSVSPEALGFFLALLPLSITPPSYRRLLSDCQIDDAWLPDAGVVDDDEAGVPQISPSFLGINDSGTALLVASFASTMLLTAQGDDSETEMLYSLLSELADAFPLTISMMYVFSVYILFSHVLSFFSATKVYRTGLKTLLPTPLTHP